MIVKMLQVAGGLTGKRPNIGERAVGFPYRWARLMEPLNRKCFGVRAWCSSVVFERGVGVRECLSCLLPQPHILCCQKYSNNNSLYLTYRSMDGLSIISLTSTHILCCQKYSNNNNSLYLTYRSMTGLSIMSLTSTHTTSLSKVFEQQLTLPHVSIYDWFINHVSYLNTHILCCQKYSNNNTYRSMTGLSIMSLTSTHSNTDIRTPTFQCTLDHLLKKTNTLEHQHQHQRRHGI